MKQTHLQLDEELRQKDLLVNPAVSQQSLPTGSILGLIKPLLALALGVACAMFSLSLVPHADWTATATSALAVVPFFIGTFVGTRYANTLVGLVLLWLAWAAARAYLGY